ncbi:MAG TPA: hypothetical protein VG937_33950 [Polyangiaceae bacterium]|nr:hypothetical protein [Polyangiaceae bacterium]
MQKVPNLIAILSAFALALAPACQAVFGDYKVDLSALNARICEVDEYRCTDELLEVCAANRSHWEVSATCPSAGQCNLNADTCRPCVAGVEHQCQDGTLFACDASGQWQKLKDCPTAALCSASAGDCLPAVCAPPEHRCQADGTLERCKADRTGWQKVTTCATPADCNAAAADAQANAGEPVTCTVSCTKGSGACAAPTCDTPGVLRCLRDFSSLQRCSETYQWAMVSQCTNFALCNAEQGRCEDARCASNERRCNGNTVEQCKPDLTGWVATQTCPAGTLCDPSAAAGSECVTGGCTSGQTRCNSLFVERCDGTRWERTKRCEKKCNPATKDCNP